MKHGSPRFTTSSLPHHFSTPSTNRVVFAESSSKRRPKSSKYQQRAGTELVAETDFLKKRCVPGMGMHWNKMNTASNCSELYPWFLTGQHDHIHGTDFQAWGRPTSASERTWWESILLWINYYTVPDAPLCSGVDLVVYGIIVEHIWFIDNPTTISCDNVKWPKI